MALFNKHGVKLGLSPVTVKLTDTEKAVVEDAAETVVGRLAVYWPAGDGASESVKIMGRRWIEASHII